MRALQRASVLAGLLLCGSAIAQEPSFEALGQVTVVAGDRVRARDRALDDALRQAVEQAVATVLDPPAVVARSSELRLRIYPKARSYVDNYRILDEGETSGVFQVHVSAQVATGRLARELASPMPEKAPGQGRASRAVVCAKGSSTVAATVERVAREALAARSVEVAPALPTCAEDAAVRAAQAVGAQAAVVGTVETSAEGAVRGTDQMAARAKVTLKLIEASGRASAEGSAERTAYDRTPAAAAEAAERAAATEATRSLQPALAARWPSEVVSGGMLVHVSGLQRYADYSSLVRALSSLPGVAAVEPRRFTRGDADLLVRTASTAAQVAAALDHQPAAGVRVSATADGDGSLKLEIAAAPAADGG